jgi:hypothetical protein
MKRASVLLTLLLFLMAPAAFGLVVIDFGTGPAGFGGQITIAGGNATGTAIPVATMNVGGSAADGSYPTSGTASGSVLANVASLDFNTALNTITITGGIPGLAIPNGTVLLSGQFASFTLVDGGLFGSINASGPDSKSPLLLAALGVPASTEFAYFGFSIGLNSAGTGSPYTATSTDITNAEVPEPTSIVLFGTLLVGTGLTLRRRFGTR